MKKARSIACLLSLAATPEAHNTQAPDVIDLGWGGYVDERTGSFRPFEGPPPALTLPSKYRAFDPIYWFRRESAWGPPDDEPFQRKTDYDYWLESQLDPTGEYSDVASRIVLSVAPILIPPLLAEGLPLEIGLEAGVLHGEAGGAATQLASELLEEGTGATGTGAANELAGGEAGGGMYGPFSHTLNKGGLRAIEESRQLLATLGRNGDEAVRASIDLAGRPATEGFFVENETTLIFRTWTPPRPITPAGWALWDMEEGQALDIDLVEIHLSY